MPFDKLRINKASFFGAGFENREMAQISCLNQWFKKVGKS